MEDKSGQESGAGRWGGGERKTETKFEPKDSLNFLVQSTTQVNQTTCQSKKLHCKSLCDLDLSMCNRLNYTTSLFHSRSSFTKGLVLDLTLMQKLPLKQTEGLQCSWTGHFVGLVVDSFSAQYSITPQLNNKQTNQETNIEN